MITNKIEFVLFIILSSFDFCVFSFDEILFSLDNFGGFDGGRSCVLMKGKLDVFLRLMNGI